MAVSDPDAMPMGWLADTRTLLSPHFAAPERQGRADGLVSPTARRLGALRAQASRSSAL